MSTIPGPRFAPEIERSIFQFAALADFARIPLLQLVARRVNIWLKPLLYRVLCVSKRGTPSQLPSLITSEAPFLAKSVHYLYLDTTTDLWLSPTQVEALLAACTGVTTLVLRNDELSPTYLPLLADMPHLRRLAVSLSTLFRIALHRIDPGHEIFVNITHLEIRDEIQQQGAMRYGVVNALSRLPALTHLAVLKPVPVNLDGLLQSLLLRMERLEVLVVLWPPNDTGRIFRNEFRDVDGLGPMVGSVILVVGWYSDDESLKTVEGRSHERAQRLEVESWKRAAKGEEEDYWMRAEKFVGAKRRGEIPARRYWMDKWVYDVFEPET
ncbi:hypothetical protein HMN09_00985800 [Mycena chlorophos]|uniref:Uncharacterized protein n=1 Tax=Mycena chlorophos TaxID=658473 RepID=A0A8H6SJ49_MYCCL|nr:hypothetical protein HMN09_00985800 [Mycena chlorophos]